MGAIGDKRLWMAEGGQGEIDGRERLRRGQV